MLLSASSDVLSDDLDSDDDDDLSPVEGLDEARPGNKSRGQARGINGVNGANRPNGPVVNK